MTPVEAKAPPWERDPFLYIHRLPNGEYSIAGKYNPASIKDQMVRAVALIDRAIFHKVLDNPRKLLVVGAGAAGASAAFRGCEHKINTTLVERNTSPFERQRNSSRVVDPTEFDWPAPHWRDAGMPGLPLLFERGPASAIAARWQEVYDQRERDDIYLTVRTRTLFVRSMQLPDGRHVALFQDVDSKDNHWEEFDFVLNCAGPGEEQVSLGDSKYASYLFWADDKLEADNFGLPSPLPQPRILISGGGDGALQDFLRIAFPGKTARDVYEHLLPEASMSLLRAEIERKIFAAEDAFRRAWVWSEDERLDCQVLRLLHQVHREVAKDAAKQIQAAKTVPRPFADRLANVRVMHSCDHFSICYAFNRFLALLVNELAGAKHFVPNRRLRQVYSAAPAAHQCDLRPAYCWEHPHEVHFSESTCAEQRDVGKPAVHDIVVLRHGPKAGTPKLARQILPYGSPWSKP
ncbi:MAG TPA: hypothetical protein VGG72_02340 [Bryobacteraceae bacterium]|jgi:hypothetical protein